MLLQGFCGGSYTSQSPLADNERTINLYPENIEAKQGATQMALYPTPGISQTGTIYPGGGGRAHLETQGREFVVIGPTFVEIDSSGNPIVSTAAAVTVDSNPATLSSNGKTGGQVMVTSGGNVYIFTLATNAWAQVAAMNGKATMGDQLDGYFLALDANTSTFYFSNLNDGLTWQTGINFANRNIASDPWVSLIVVNRYIWLMGSETSEIWYDAGTYPMPFTPYASSDIPFGCGAQFSPGVLSGQLLWLARTKDGGLQIVQSAGFVPTVISTYAISVLLDGYSTVADAVGDTYTSLGHGFYMLSFPSAKITLCYDLNTKLWHERGTWIAEDNEYVAWRPRFHAFAYGQHRMLDSNTGAVYHMSETFTTDVDSRPIRWLRRSPIAYSENERIFIDAFELDLEIGFGNDIVIPPSTLLTGITSYWKLNEVSDGSGAVTRIDSVTSSANDLTDTNTVPSATGKIALGGSFTEANSETLTHASNASLQTGDIDFFWAAWVNLTAGAFGGRKAVLSKGVFGSGPEYFLCYNKTSDRFTCQVNGSTELSATSLGSPGFGVWHLVCFWHDSVNNTVNIRVDMGTIDSVAYAGGGTTNAIAFFLGSSGAARFHNGFIDEVGFWKRILTESEQAELYNGFIGRSYPFTSIAAEPQVMMRQSMDGGKTWGIEHMRSVGARGAYGTRVRWNRLGAGRRRVFEVSGTDGIPWRILGAFIEPRQAPAGIVKPQLQQAG